MKKKGNIFVTFGHLIVFAVLMGAGVNAGFVIDSWFQPVFGADNPINILIALVSGGLLGIGMYGLFLHSENAIRSALASNDHDNLKRVRIGAIIALNVLFIGVGVAGLLYRLQYVNQRGVQYLILIGVMLEISTPLFGLAMHPMMHRPVELIEDELEQDFGRSHVQELYGAVKQLPLHARNKWYEGEENEVLEGMVDAARTKEEEQAARSQIQANRRSLSRRRGMRGNLSRMWNGDPDFQETLPEKKNGRVNR